MKDISVVSIIVLVLSYYFAWITGLYSIDLILYIVSNHQYTLFGYMLENIYLSLVMFLTGFVITQFIRPWSKGGEERDSSSGGSGVVNMQYFQNLSKSINGSSLGRPSIFVVLFTSISSPFSSL